MNPMESAPTPQFSDLIEKGQKPSPLVFTSEAAELEMHEKPALKRILLVMMQPPGSSGVQGLIYNKILPYLEECEWEFHFAGPDPSMASVLTESVQCPKSRLHYTTNISWSKRFSVLKNRCRKNTLPYVAYGLLQILATLAEKVVRHDANTYLLSGIEKVVMAADETWNYDLIAGKSPAFMVLDATAELTARIKKPLVAMVVDPHGARDGLSFWPSEEQRQHQILDQCCGAMFMSPLTLKRYVDAGLVAADKAYAFTDSFPSSGYLYQSGLSFLKQPAAGDEAAHDGSVLHLVHLGMLPEWRPIGPLMDAIKETRLSLDLDIFGFLYPQAVQQIQADPLLSRRVRCFKPVSYSESHHIAEDCGALLVVIGPRHLDNQPSKFFEYLGHKKPVFVIGPLGNPIEDIVNDLGIGVYCDVSDSQAIKTGLLRLDADYESMIRAFDLNQDMIERYSAKSVAAHWSWCLNRMLQSPKSPTA